MKEFPDIVHIVISEGKVIGVFDLDSTAKEFAKGTEYASTTEPWVVSKDDSVATRLESREAYKEGDRVMFDDGEDRGCGRVDFIRPNLYRILADRHEKPVVWMLHEDILGIYSESA
jgi:hypothetical protein